MNTHNDRVLELIFENTHTCIAYLDTGFNFVRVNAAYAATDAKTPEYFINKNHFELYPNEENKAIFGQVINTGIPHFEYAKPFEFQYAPERGVTHWDWSLHPVYDHQGDIIGLILNLVDVSKRIQLEQELTREKQFNQAVLHCAGAMVVVLDATGKVVRFNKACEATTYYSAGEICGTYLWERLLIPEERDKVKAVFRNLASSALPNQFTNYWVTKNGGKRLISWWNTVIADANGIVTHVVAVGIDITERKKIDDALKQQAQIIDQIHDAVVSTDLEGIVTSWNRGAETMFGYGANEAIGKHIAFVYPEEHHDTLFNHVIAPLKEKGAHDIEVTMRKKTGEDFFAHLSLSLQKNSDGEVIGMLGYSMDITERKRAEQKLLALNEELEKRVQQRTRELQQSTAKAREEIEVRKRTETQFKKAKEEAEKANRLKSEFLSRMSHELRTPMNAILGFGQLFQQQKLDSQHREYINEIMTAGHHLLSLINEVLDLAKIEAGKMDIKMTSVCLHDITTQCIALVSSAAKENNIVLHDAILESQSIFLHTDKERIKEVLTNLLVNAVKYNRQGGGVRLWAQALPESVVRINVTDTGPGLSTDQIEGLFEPFNRLGAEYSDIQGTGIGLCIAKQLMERMQGRIGVDSKSGEGSTFWIECPLSIDEISDLDSIA